jgi:riboflavin transporter FmnP
MKSALKLLVTFGVGCLIGIVLVCAGIVSFTDMTWNELVQKLAKIEALEMVGIFAGSIVCTLVAFILQIVLPLGRRYCQYVGSAFGFCGLVCGGRSFSSAGTISGYDVFCRCVVGIAQWHPIQEGNY